MYHCRHTYVWLDSQHRACFSYSKTICYITTQMIHLIPVFLIMYFLHSEQGTTKQIWRKIWPLSVITHCFSFLQKPWCISCPISVTPLRCSVWESPNGQNLHSRVLTVFYFLQLSNIDHLNGHGQTMTQVCQQQSVSPWGDSGCSWGKVPLLKISIAGEHIHLSELCYILKP